MHSLWHSKEGENKSEFPNQTQSWAALKASADKIDSALIPKVFQKQQRLLPFFLLVYPHRITSNNIKFLDSLVT